MDISKLPKLSQTEAPPPASQPPTAPVPADYRSAGAAYTDARSSALPVAEAWIATIVGLIFVYLGWRFGSYLLSLVSGRPFHTNYLFQDPDPRAGQEVPYAELIGHAMINDAAMFLFGLSALFDAAVIASVFLPNRVRKPLLVLALVLTVAATVFNLFVAIIFFKDGVLPLFSLLAVAIGGYTAVVQWIMLKQHAPSDGAVARG